MENEVYIYYVGMNRQEEVLIFIFLFIEYYFFAFVVKLKST